MKLSDKEITGFAILVLIAYNVTGTNTLFEDAYNKLKDNNDHKHE